jgi:hypothetical protein
MKVIPQLACRLRPHQREGVQFLFECTMGLRGFEGQVWNLTLNPFFLSLLVRDAFSLMTWA